MKCTGYPHVFPTSWWCFVFVALHRRRPRCKLYDGAECVVISATFYKSLEVSQHFGRV